MIAFFGLLVLFSLVLSKIFPKIYLREKAKTLEQCQELSGDDVVTNTYPIMGLVIFLLPMLIFNLSGGIILSVFCFFLAISAYADLSTRWIPDLLIYSLLAIAVYSLSSKETIPAVMAAIFFIAPAAMLSLYGSAVKKMQWIASGDYYIFPAVGLMVMPEYAASIMLITLLIALLISRRVEKVPLVTVVYLTFTGYQLCNLLGML